MPGNGRRIMDSKAMVLSPLAGDHVHRPRHRGPLDNVEYGVVGSPGDGPYVEVWDGKDYLQERS